jgi:Peptidase family S41/Tricorn protease C1 domain
MLDETVSFPDDLGTDNDLMPGTENSNSGMSTTEYAATDTFADTQYSDLALDSLDANNLQSLSLTEESTDSTTTNQGSDIDNLTGYDNKDALVGEADSLDGIWQSDGYGYIFEIKGNELDAYEVTKNSAISSFTATNVDQTPGDGEIDFVRDNDASFTFEIKSTATGDTKRLHADGSEGDIILNRLDEKPTVLDTPTPNDPQTNFDVFWDNFAENYALFPIKDIDWSAVKEEARSQITSETTPEELFEILSSAIAPLEDAHTGIIAEDIGKQFQGERADTDFEGTLQKVDQIEGVTDKYLSTPLQSWANGQISYGMLDSETGYLQIESFAGYTDSGKFTDDLAELDTALDTIFSQAEQPESLVIDLRANQGGSDVLGIEIASRLTDKPYLAYTKVARNDPNDPSQFTEPQPIVVTPSNKPSFHGDVAVLTSGYTVSAGETFTQALMGREQEVVRIGQNTQGVFSDVLVRTLPNGWQFGLPNELFVTDEGTTFDGAGVPPDVEVPVFTDEDLANGRDSAIEKAQEILSS